MKRKIYQQMEKWKKDGAGETCLLIDGARRTGKSYAAEEFAREHYRSYILIDFNKAGDDVRDLFDHDMNDLDTFFVYLSAIYGVQLYKGESLIILDEVQLFPRARSAVKYLVQDGRYDYMETGSLMSIKENTDNILIPSEERHIKMYPMDFEEFLWAMSEEPLYTLIKLNFEKHRPMGDSLHRKAMTLFRQYLIIGGMPQAVAKYVETRSFNSTDAVKRDILELYREDMVKHAGKYAVKAESVFDEIPEQLSKHEKKFMLSSLGHGSKYRDFEDAFFWLGDSMICNIAYNSTEPSVGLKMNRDRTTLKIYMGDTGLLISHAFDEESLEQEQLYKKLLLGKLDLNEGMIFENVVAQMLTAAGHKLYFYSNASRNDAKSRMEIDFLISKSKITSRHNISPLEVKSSRRYTYTSLNKFINKYREQVDRPVIIHTADYSEKNGITYLPVYMTGLI